MGRTIEDYLNEANDIIEKRASAPTRKAPSDDEIVKLADILTAQETPVQFEMTLFEKAAYAIALADTVKNIEELQKIASFEKTARERGFSEEQINEFLEKKALDEGKLSKYLAVTGAAGLGGLAGHMMGTHKGKKEGYDHALSDLQHALQQE